MAAVSQRSASVPASSTVCLFGHFDPEYLRNRQVAAALDALGHHVVQVQAEGPVPRRWRTLARAARTQRYAVLWVAFLGYSDVPLAWLLSKRRRVPLVFDAFVLLHDTLVTEGAVRRRSVTAVALRGLEILACHLADVVVIDTEEHAARLARRTHLDRNRIRVVVVGSDHEHACGAPPSAPTFRAAFCGSYLPLHGVDVIVRAASRLRDEPAITCTLIGDGPTRAHAERLAASLGCGNLAFVDPIRGDALRRILCDAQAILGAFGTSDKAAVVIPNKVIDGLALGRPVITARTPALDRVLDASAVITVPPGDSEALAAAILGLYRDPGAGARIGAAGRRAFEATFSPAALKEGVRTVLDAAGLRAGGKAVERE